MTLKSLQNPEVAARRKANAAFVHLITTKAANWGKENGFENLLTDIDVFMTQYKQAQEKPNYWDAQSPEVLMGIITKSQERSKKALEALNRKV